MAGAPDHDAAGVSVLVTSMKTADRLEQLEVRLARIEERLDNHVAHISQSLQALTERMRGLDARLWWVLGLLVSTMLAVWVRR